MVSLGTPVTCTKHPVRVLRPHGTVPEQVEHQRRQAVPVRDGQAHQPGRQQFVRVRRWVPRKPTPQPHRLQAR